MLRNMTRIACSILLLASIGIKAAAAEEEFVSLFNGRDLEGWVNVNCAPETWSVREGMIHCTGKPTGALRTTRQYENFIFEVDWRHLKKGGNAGIFIWSSPIAAPGVPFLRAIEVQVLDHGYDERGKGEWYTTHGDVFPIHGSTMTPFGRHNGSRSFPSEERSNPSPEWNHYRIVCNNGILRLSVNGKEVSGGENCNYRKGYIGLESEGSPVDFRNPRIHVFPSSDALAEMSAPVDPGWRSLFTGLDLRGWATNSVKDQPWSVQGELLVLKGAAPSSKAILWTEEEFGDLEWVVDCRLAKVAEGAGLQKPALHIRGVGNTDFALPLTKAEPGVTHRFTVELRGRQLTLTTDNQPPERMTLPAELPARGKLGLASTGSTAEFRNLYIRQLTGK